MSKESMRGQCNAMIVYLKNMNDGFTIHRVPKEISLIYLFEQSSFLFVLNPLFQPDSFSNRFMCV